MQFSSDKSASLPDKKKMLFMCNFGLYKTLCSVSGYGGDGNCMVVVVRGVVVVLVLAQLPSSAAGTFWFINRYMLAKFIKLPSIFLQLKIFINKVV